MLRDQFTHTFLFVQLTATYYHIKSVWMHTVVAHIQANNTKCYTFIIHEAPNE